jgi:predicted small lipoprotein YifL
MTHRRTRVAGLVLLALCTIAACGTTPPEMAPPASAPAATTSPPAASASATPVEEVAQYRDINCANWPAQTPTRRTAAARAALDWLREHPDILGPAVPAPDPTDVQVAAVVEGVTTECAGRQHGSHLVDLMAAAAILYEESADLHP